MVDENENVGVLSFVNPVGPLAIVVSGAVVSTVNVLLAGDGSTFPAASIARTSKLCEPSLNAAVVNGDPQVANAPESTRHSNRDPDSVDENENVGVLSFVNPVGPPVIVVSGALLSSVNVLLAGEASRFPTASTARTSNTCGPSLSGVVVWGELHGSKNPPSTRHSNLASGSLDENENVGLLSAVTPLGPPVIVVSGAVVSTVNVLLAGEGSTMPCALTARTSNVCSPSPMGPVG